MSKILITGATGGVGRELIKQYHDGGNSAGIVAGVRNISSARERLSEFSAIELTEINFEEPGTFTGALDGIETVFLLRPPQLSDVNKYFIPFFEAMKSNSVKRIVFLSVQGVEKSKVIPHHKIEALINDYGFDSIFLRPSYFMQNLSTALWKDIQENDQIVLPAGRAKFNWVDVQDIARTAKAVLDDFPDYAGGAFEITGEENMDFYQAAEILSAGLNRPITFKDVSPLRFYRLKRREKYARGMILVMIMLHYLPRFQKEPEISSFYETVTGEKPTSLEKYVSRELSNR